MITTNTSDGVLTITFDRPAQRNALTLDGLSELAEAVEQASEPVIYIHGNGSAFCAGADLDTVAGLDTEQEAVTFVRHGQQVARTIQQTDAATVAGIDGAARGGGFELALACDIRVATPDATFAESGVSIGLFGAWGGTVRLPKIVGQGEAMDIALSGRVLDADEALRMGLVSRIVEHPGSVAVELAEHDPDTLQTIKQRMRDDAGRAAQERREAAAFARLIKQFESPASE